MTAVAAARGWESIGWDCDLADPVDVTDETSVEAALSQALRGGVPNAVVCAAGVLVTGNLATTSAEDWARVLGVNLMGVVNTLRSVSAAWTDAGLRGRAVIVSSMAGERGMASGVAYSASKAAVNALVLSTALDWAPAGHRINAVLPGSVDTPMLRRHIAANGGVEAERKLLAVQPLGRLAQPSEIAQVCAFLLAEESSYLTGSLVATDGALALGYG